MARLLIARSGLATRLILVARRLLSRQLLAFNPHQMDKWMMVTVLVQSYHDKGLVT